MTAKRDERSPWLDFVHPEDRQLTVDAGGRLFEGTSIVYFENRYRCKDSSYRWLQWHAEMVGDEAYCTGRDVTQEHLQKDARNQRHVEDMAEVLPLIVWTARPDGELDYYNRSWFAYTGMPIEETRGWGWTPVLHPEDRQTCVERWTEAFRSGKPYDLEVRLKRASDGTYRSDATTIATAKAGGAAGYLLMPFREHDLKAVIALALQKRSSAAGIGI